MLNLGVNAQRIAAKGNNRFTPRALFASGEAGVWYDPSDLTTMRQTGASGLPAIIGQPVGLMLDKSQGVKLGSELITNGDFAADSNWVEGTGWSISGGVGVANNATGGNLRQNGVALEENKVYSITFTIVSRSAGAVLGRFGGTPAVDSVSFNQVGTYTFFLKANSTNSSFMLRGQGGFTGTVDNVSVKEVLGNHAIQTTSVNRPVLARHPEGGIRNLLSYTQEFDDAFWTKGGNTSVSAGEVDPNGGSTASRVQLPAGSGTYLMAPVQLIEGVKYTFSIYLKNNGSPDLNIGVGPSVSSGVTEGVNYTVTNEWVRYVYVYTAATSSQYWFGVDNRGNSDAVDVYAWGAQLEEGSTATQYQHVTDDLRYDITEPFGANSLNYLKFDGVSDGMSLTGLTSPLLLSLLGLVIVLLMLKSSTNKYLLDIQTGRTVFAASTDVAGNIGYFDGLWRSFNADANAIKVLTYDLVENDAKIRVTVLKNTLIRPTTNKL